MVFELTMKTAKIKSAAEIASDETVAAMSEQDIQYALRSALHRARRWYRLHGRKFRLPVCSTKRKAKR